MKYIMWMLFYAWMAEEKSEPLLTDNQKLNTLLAFLVLFSLAGMWLIWN